METAPSAPTNGLVPRTLATREHPIVIIGGGPAGSTAGHCLAKKGHHVLLLDKEEFPRFHVGESLLPATQLIWDRIGIAAPLEGAGFKKKLGAEFRLGKGPDKSGYFMSMNSFDQVVESAQFDRSSFSYQVERAKFDHFLLQQAQMHGVEVHNGARVKDVVPGKMPKVTYLDDKGETHVVDASFVIDASGRNAMLSRKFGLFVDETSYSTGAVFGHFTGVKWPEGERSGYLNAYFVEDGWVWLIPLACGKTSVGICANKDATAKWPKDPEMIMRETLGRYPCLRERMEGAVQVAPIRTLKNLPYHATKFTGEGWALIGDAAFFVDPILSSGIHLAFYSGEEIAKELDAHLNGDATAMARYEKTIRIDHKYVHRNVSAFYKSLHYHITTWFFVRSTGDLFRHWSGPWLKRVMTWSAGHYDRYIGSMYLWWTSAFITTNLAKIFHAVTGLPRWGRHGAQPGPLTWELPRSPELQMDMDKKLRPRTQSTTEFGELSESYMQPDQNMPA